MRSIHGTVVHGDVIDDETRCAHYAGISDVIAIRFKCCDRWYPCHACHAAKADHPVEVWPVSEFSERAVLCGRCGHQLTVAQYFACASTCPSCCAGFNPACANHYHLYFEI